MRKTYLKMIKTFHGTQQHFYANLCTNSNGICVCQRQYFLLIFFAHYLYDSLDFMILWTL